MAQITAGETIIIRLEDQSQLTVKIEDASKSDRFSAKVVASDCERYQPDQICEFDRALLR